ncbi:MAG: PEGA domain-containing protein [Myxococcales bacterium]|nr:PEGA domain-containing protein [Myxococcota bacterium]MDW8283220.1 PEGA domain-containing protein [Myxococcales bacterium]
MRDAQHHVLRIDHTLGRTPLPGPISTTPGVHQVRLSKVGYAPYSEIFHVYPQRVASLLVDMVPIAGVLRVRTGGDKARVFVDGKFSGETPTDIELLTGPHTVRVVRSGFHEEIFTVNASPGLFIDRDVQLRELPAHVKLKRQVSSEPRRLSNRWWIWTLSVLGAAAVATAVIVPTVYASRSPCQRADVELCFSINVGQGDAGGGHDAASRGGGAVLMRGLRLAVLMVIPVGIAAAGRPADSQTESLPSKGARHAAWEVRHTRHKTKGGSRRQTGRLPRLAQQKKLHAKKRDDRQATPTRGPGRLRAWHELPPPPPPKPPRPGIWRKGGNDCKEFGAPRITDFVINGHRFTPRWIARTLHGVIADHCRSKNYTDLLPLDGGTVGISHFAAGSLRTLYRHMDLRKYFGKHAEHIPARPYRFGWWRAGMWRFLHSPESRAVQQRAWKAYITPVLMEALKHGWSTDRELAIAAGVGNSLGPVGFVRLARRHRWNPEETLLAYARMTAHKERRRLRINREFPRDDLLSWLPP